jgi:prepilin-type N-terminal cleavage/methylation domain-containing protein
MKTTISPVQDSGPGSPPRPQSGFTLVEILVVVAVIGILAAVALPTLDSVTNKAKDATCLNNLRQLHLGSLSFAQDNNNNTPIVQDTYWHRRVISYLVPGTGPSTFQQGPGKPNYNPSNFKSFICPMDTNPLNGVLSYGMNQLANKKFSALPGRMILIGDVPSGQYTLAPTLPAKDQGSARHGEKYDNFIFVDGHAEALVYPKYSDPENASLWKP